MVLPLNNNSDPYHEYTYYQGVIASELVTTAALFVLLQMVHYCAWGHEEEEFVRKKEEEGGEGVQPPPLSQWKWSQKSWNLYFSIIFGNHICAVFLPMAYLPNILTCVLAYSHFACFFGVLINEIFVTEKRPGEGGKTKANRVFWVLMCLFNLALIAAGLAGVPQVLQ